MRHIHIHIQAQAPGPDLATVRNRVRQKNPNHFLDVMFTLVK